MSSRRALKLAEAIRHVVSSAILFELKDPRVRDVTVTYVEVSGDLRFAKVHVSVMGDEKQQRLTLCGLENAAGFLQSRCAEKIETRWTPKLQFVLDQGVKHSIEVARILAEVLPPPPENEQPDAVAEVLPQGEDEDEVSAQIEDETPDRLEAETPTQLDDEHNLDDDHNKHARVENPDAHAEIAEAPVENADARAEHPIARVENPSTGEESADHSAAELAPDKNRSKSDENAPSVSQG